VRICFLADAGSIHTYRFAKFFVDGGHEVKVISMRPARGEFKALSAELYANTLVSDRFLLHALANLVKAPRILREIRRFKPDILHVHDVFCYGPFALLSGRPYLVTPWGSDVLIASRKAGVLSAMVRRVIRRATTVLYDGGEHMRERLLELGAAAAGMQTFAFGVDVKLFVPDKRSDEVRRELGCTPEGHLVISTRNLEPVYDIACYVRAAAAVVQDAPGTRFIVVGDGSLRQELEALASELGVAEHVQFAGRVTMDQMSAYVASSDVYVSSSTSDAGIAASTAEAMASGVPAVITDFGDNGNWVRDGENGFLFPVGDAEALADRIVTLLRDPELRARCGKVNTAVIEERNNYYREMASVEELYRRLLAEG